MSMEVQVLALSGLFACALLVFAAIFVNLQVGPSYLAGPRDEQRTATGVAGRLWRAYQNHVEGLVLYGGATAAIEFSGANNPTTAMAAQAYLVARLLYVPAYATGIPYLRSAIWAVGFGGTMVLYLAAIDWKG
jgi:uncharacterized MAPEG superfamily protein